MKSECPFCRRIAEGSIIARTGKAVSISDAYPVSDGHALVVPISHQPDLFLLDTNELSDVWALVGATARGLKGLGADGVNIGINVGAAAGQTVEHAHVHVIPRRLGDVPDPRGGVRWVLPERAAYWERHR